MARSWDDPVNDLVDERREASYPRRAQRAVRGRDRVATAGMASLRRAGQQASVVDPSFGDNYRQIEAPMQDGYTLRVTPPTPSADDDGSNDWSARIDPPGVQHYVAGEEVHRAALGVFHPRELHSRVQAYLSQPDVMAAMSKDGDNLVQVMHREQRSARRGAMVHDINRNLGTQFGE